MPVSMHIQGWPRTWRTRQGQGREQQRISGQLNNILHIMVKILSHSYVGRKQQRISGQLNNIFHANHGANFKSLNFMVLSRNWA